MENEQDLVDQLGWCITTQDYLNDLNIKLKDVVKEYQYSVDDLKEFGYFKTEMLHLENLCSEFKTTIDGVVGYVESEHIEYMAARSVTISGVLSRNLGL